MKTKELQQLYASKKEQLDELAAELDALAEQIRTNTDPTDDTLHAGSELVVDGVSGFVGVYGPIMVWTPQPTSENPRPRPVYLASQTKSEAIDEASSKISKKS